MNTAYLIQQIELLLREQDSIYHNTAVRFGLSDTAMRVLYLVSETDAVSYTHLTLPTNSRV